MIPQSAHRYLSRSVRRNPFQRGPHMPGPDHYHWCNRQVS